MGMMRINMRIHGGNRGFMEAMSGLIVRNERAIRNGTIPLPDQARVTQDPSPLWRDGPTALADGVASAGTMAAWMAAAERVHGRPATMAMVNGIPAVVRPAEPGVGFCPEISPPSTVPLYLPQGPRFMDGPDGIVANVGGRQLPHRGPSARRGWSNFGSSAFMNPLGMALTPGATAPNGTLRLPQVGGFGERAAETLSERILGKNGVHTVSAEGGQILVLTSGDPGDVSLPRSGLWEGLPIRVQYAPAPVPFTGGGRWETIGGCNCMFPFGGKVRPQDLSGALDDTNGRVSEWLHLLIDDDDGLPIRELGNSIAQHNAQQILDSIGTDDEIHSLYDPRTKVVYKVEGLPEIWKDSREMREDGFDDCEGLAADRAGELIARHQVPARVHTRNIKAPADFPGGAPASRMFHAVTEVGPSDAPIGYDDPSVRLGMPCPEWYWEYAKNQRKQGLPL